MKQWTDPKVLAQRFVVNDFVSACIEGKIQCRLPGKSSNEYNDGTNTYVDGEKKWHGICGNDAYIVFDGTTGHGFEVVGGRIDYSRPIYDIEGFSPIEGTYYDVTWTSRNDHAQDHGEYHHIGKLEITRIIEDRPNHS